MFGDQNKFSNMIYRIPKWLELDKFLFNNVEFWRKFVISGNDKSIICYRFSMKIYNRYRVSKYIERVSKALLRKNWVPDWEESYCKWCSMSVHFVWWRPIFNKVTYFYEIQVTLPISREPFRNLSIPPYPKIDIFVKIYFKIN